MPTNEELMLIAQMNQRKKLQDDTGEISDEELQAIANSANDSANDTPEFIQEKHPDITVADRFMVKNFGGDNAASVKYLQRKHPGLDITTINDRIAIKRPNEKAYKALDPEFEFFSPSTWAQGLELEDVSDVAWDVGAGITEGLASAGAGLAGAGISAGAGALPAAMAAGGATSAGLESVRQAIGTQAGVREGMDLGQVGIMGALGAAGPAVFGAGISSKKLAAKGLADTLGDGLIQRLGKKMPKLASIMSRAREESFIEYGDEKSLQKLISWEKSPDDIVPGEINRFGNTVRELDDKIWQKVEDMYDKEYMGRGEVFDVSSVKQIFKDTIDEVEAVARDKEKGLLSGDAEIIIKDLKDMYKGAFHSKKKNGAALIKDAEDKFQRQIDLAGNNFDVINSIKAEKEKFIDALKEKIEMGDELYTGKIGWDKVKMLKKGFQKKLEDSFNVTTTTNKDKAVRAVLKKVKDQFDVIADETDPLQQIARMKEEGVDEALIPKTGEQIREGFKKAKEQSAWLQKAFWKKVKDGTGFDYSPTFDTLRFLKKPNKRMLLNKLQEIEAELIADGLIDPAKNSIMKQANLLMAFMELGKPDYLPLGAGGVTSTTQQLAGQPLTDFSGGIGYRLGSIFGAAGGRLGATIAKTAAGMTMQGPKAWKFYLQTGRRLGKAGAAMVDATGGYTGQVPWQTMKNLYSNRGE